MDRDAHGRPRSRLPEPGTWTILDVLGDDEAGKRFLARCADGSRFQLVQPPREAQSSLAYRERLKRKIAAARKIDHDAVVPTLGCVEDAGVLFLVEPHVPGVSLDELIRSGEPLDPDAVLEVGADIARALAVLHRYHLVHGWVRPRAVVVTDEVARLRGCGLVPPKGETAEHPEFMSPEQLSEDRSVRPESDFFSLGSTLFAAMVGRPPFVGDSPAEIADAVRNGRPTLHRPGEPELPEPVRRLFAKLLAADPKQRPRSAAELRDDLQAARRGEPVARAPEVPPEPEAPPPEKRKRPRAVAAAAAVLAAAAALVVLLAPPRPGDTPRGGTGGAATSPPAQVARTSAPAVTTGPARPTPPAGAPSREELAADAYDVARRFARTHPRRFDEILRRFQKVAAAYPGTKAALKAAKHAADWELKKNSSRLADFAAVQKAADALVREKKFGEAIAAYERYRLLQTAPDGPLPAGERDRIERQISFVRAKARDAYARDSDEAIRATEARRYRDAIAVYEQVAATYGLPEYVRLAKQELAVLRPLRAAQEKAAAERRARELERAYRAAAARLRERVQTFDFEGAVAESEKLVARLRGSVLEANASRHLARLRRLLALKRLIIRRINGAKPKLTSQSLGLRAPASVLRAADARGITLAAGDRVEVRPWAKLSDWEKYAIARQVSDLESGDDLAALGLLSLEQGHRERAGADLERARRFGARVDDLLARAVAPPTEQRPAETRPAKMLAEARARVAQKKWLDALALLIPLKETHAATDYATRRKLDEINALLAACGRGLARADLDRDLAAGVETALLAGGLGDWQPRGNWTFANGRAACNNRADHDVELLRPVSTAPAYRLSVRCRVLSGNGLLVRVASDGDRHYDFWLGLGDEQKTGLWVSTGGKVRKSKLLPLRVRAGQWVTVRAVVTGRFVRVECGGRAVSFPNRLATGPGAQRFVGLFTRQASAAEFEDFRIRVLREQ